MIPLISGPSKMKECRTFVTRTTRATPLDIRDTSYVKLKARGRLPIGHRCTYCMLSLYSLLARRSWHNRKRKTYDIVALCFSLRRELASRPCAEHISMYTPAVQAAVSFRGQHLAYSEPAVRSPRLHVNERPSKSRRTRGSCCLYWSYCYNRSFTARNISRRPQ